VGSFCSLSLQLVQSWGEHSVTRIVSKGFRRLRPTRRSLVCRCRVILEFGVKRPGSNRSRAQRICAESYNEENGSSAHVLPLSRCRGDVRPANQRNHCGKRIKPHAVRARDVLAVPPDREEREYLRNELEYD